MRVLVVGSGGREHAIVWKLLSSRAVSEAIVAPGNAGTAAIAENVPVGVADVAGLVALASQRRVDLVVVGPEQPLAGGLVDALEAAGIRAFGPSREAARLEASKSFAHEMMASCGVPCATSRVFIEFRTALEYAASLQPPFVVKADGLAAGKGAIIVLSQHEAEEALRDILVRRLFGSAGDRVVIEDFLPGREVSLLAFVDGERVAPMVPSCDYKRALDGDGGLNTGGMGCYSPPGFFDSGVAERAVEVAIKPVVRAMAEAGHPFRGVLYAGLMVKDTSIHVLEFNARFGDPETQVILPRLASDFASVLLACVDGSLDPESVRWRPGCSVGVVIASGGYPGPYRKGVPITGLELVAADVNVFHAGTKLDEHGQVVTDGGRVLNVVAVADTIAEARDKVYASVPRVAFADMMYRTDIALREVV